MTKVECMTLREIAEAVEFNAYDIAVEIKCAEDAISISKRESERSRDNYRAAAYEQIVGLILNEK